MGIKVCTVGRICYQKNPALFNSVAELLPDFQFLWIGDGELRAVLKAPNITVLGWMERKNAIMHLMRSDIFLLTSLWEGLPIALLEAMYLKRLCIVSDVVGNNNVIKDGLNGFICHTADEYANLIKSIINDDSKFEQITSNARKDIIDNYNADFLAEKYDAIYKEVIFRKKKSIL